MKQNFQKNKGVTGKNPFFLIGSFCTHHSIMVVLYGNDALSILMLSTKKRDSSFLKKVLVFQKICFKTKVL